MDGAARIQRRIHRKWPDLRLRWPAARSVSLGASWAMAVCVAAVATLPWTPLGQLVHPKFYTVNARIRANADLVVRQLGPDSGIPNFGFNIASIEWLDGFIERQRSRPDVDDRFVDRLVNIIGVPNYEFTQWFNTPHGCR